MYRLARTALFRLDGERAHDLSLAGLELLHRLRLQGLLTAAPDPAPLTRLGLHFANPVGLAAGLDKNGRHIDALAALGFGFIEVGTVTPRAQVGNPKPRLFRVASQQAIINRFGFNNDGVDALVRNVARARYEGVLGINIGKNGDTPNEHALDDYLHCLERVHEHASYITVNISSPNTKGLRELQAKDALHALIHPLREAQERLAAQQGRRVPMLLKIAPDLDEAALDAIAETVLHNEVDGLICTNTTIDRNAVAGLRHGDETGGLSGQPLLAMSTDVLRAMAARVGDKVLLVGVGGICSGADAQQKIAAGAQLVQLYSGLVYRGPGLVRECVNALRSTVHDGDD